MFRCTQWFAFSFLLASHGWPTVAESRDLSSGRRRERLTCLKDKGFVVLAFPSNDFAGQEPGSNSEIKQFCTSKYDVTFPVFAKVMVSGGGICPLYRRLTDPATKTGGEIEWNFAKFLVNRKGEVVARFPAGLKPEAKPVTTAIEKELAVKPLTLRVADLERPA